MPFLWLCIIFLAHQKKMDIESTLKSELLSDIGKIYDRINNLPREIDLVVSAAFERIEDRVNAIEPEIEKSITPKIAKMAATAIAIDQAGTYYRDGIVEATNKFKQVMIEILSNHIKVIAENAISINKDIIGEMVQQKVSVAITKAYLDASIEQKKMPPLMQFIAIACGFSIVLNLFLVVFLIKNF